METFLGQPLISTAESYYVLDKTERIKMHIEKKRNSEILVHF